MTPLSWKWQEMSEEEEKEKSDDERELFHVQLKCTVFVPGKSPSASAASKPDHPIKTN